MDQILRNAIDCPCCGQPVEGAKFLADPVMNVITNGDKTINLTTQQFRLARFLIDKFPMTASKDAIYDCVFMKPNGEGPDMKIVDVLVCKIRPHLAEIGLVVETVWGKGYRLVEADADQAMAIRDTSIRMRGKGSAFRWKPEHDEKLLELMRAKYTASHCATIMKIPYMTVERHMRMLRPILDQEKATA